MDTQLLQKHYYIAKKEKVNTLNPYLRKLCFNLKKLFVIQKSCKIFQGADGYFFFKLTS